MIKTLIPYEPSGDRDRLRRYRILLAAQTDHAMRDMLEELIGEAEGRLSSAGHRE